MPSAASSDRHDADATTHDGTETEPTVAATVVATVRGHRRRRSTAHRDRAATAAATGTSAADPAARYKTELCRSYAETGGSCRYGSKCQFAHGVGELRAVDRHPRYKTQLCRTFHARGFCAYGPRCHFIHNVDELRRSADQVTNPLCLSRRI